MPQVRQYAQELDERFVAVLSRAAVTLELVRNPVLRLISELFFVMFVVLFAYETFYWLGIYLGLWKYHARDIFTEIPVHCAHVYVRVNVAEKASVDLVREYYLLKQNYNLLSWRRLNDVGTSVFRLEKFVKYHFEFSPEDFEKNPEPEHGSTVQHLREKVLNTYKESPFAGGDVSWRDVLIFSKNSEVTQEQDSCYLAKVGIETGNVIDAIVMRKA